MMKKTFVPVILGIILCFVILWASGCFCMPPVGGKGCAQMSETEAEGHRRHLRNARINHQQMMEDIDTFMLYDEPSALTDKRLP